MFLALLGFLKYALQKSRHIHAQPFIIQHLVRLKWSLCPTSEDFYGQNTSLCNHSARTSEPTSFFDMLLLIYCWAKYLFSFSQDCSLPSGSLAMEALLIGGHWEKCIHILMQYNTIEPLG